MWSQLSSFLFYLRSFWVLAYGEPLRNGQYRFFLRAYYIFFRKSPLVRSAFLFTSTQKVHRPRSDSPQHFDIQNIYSTLAPKISFLALCVLLFTHPLERWPQVYRIKIIFTLLLTNRFVSTTMNAIKFLEKLDSTEKPCSFEKCPTD